MLYLLDANILITAERDYYPIEQVPEFWDWMLHQAQSNVIKLPYEIIQEVLVGGKDAEKDPLLNWLKSGGVEDVLTLQEEVNEILLQRVVEDGYAPNLTDTELQEIANDPFLIAYVLANSSERTVVTSEVSKPSRKRQNRHVPDVCNDLDVTWCTIFAMNRALGFKTAWRA